MDCLIAATRSLRAESNALTQAFAAILDEDDDWVPPANAVPFGPFLALAALEQLFAGEWLASLYERLVSKLVM